MMGDGFRGYIDEGWIRNEEQAGRIVDSTRPPWDERMGNTALVQNIVKGIGPFLGRVASGGVAAELLYTLGVPLNTIIILVGLGEVGSYVIPLMARTVRRRR